MTLKWKKIKWVLFKIIKMPNAHGHDLNPKLLNEFVIVLNGLLFNWLVG